MPTVPSFSGGIMSGVLAKLDTSNGELGKKRLFLLSENSLSYFRDEREMKTQTPKGGALLTSETTVESMPVLIRDIPNCFRVTTPSKTLILSADDTAEMNDWIAAIQRVVSALNSQKRGYLLQKAYCRGAEWNGRYVLLSRTALAYYKSEYTTNRVKGVILLTSKCSIVERDSDPSIMDRPHCFSVTDGSRTVVLAAPTNEEKEEWLEEIRRVLSSASVDRLPSMLPGGLGGCAGELIEGADRSGYLGHRENMDPSVPWACRYFILKGQSLVFMSSSSAVWTKGDLTISPDATVFSTTLRPFSFQVVTAETVIHAEASSEEERMAWVVSLRRAIVLCSRSSWSSTPSISCMGGGGLFGGGGGWGGGGSNHGAIGAAWGDGSGAGGGGGRSLLEGT